MRPLCSFALLLSFALPLAGCGKKADTVNRASLEDGKTYTHKLKFWMKNRGLVGKDLVDNVHFDDGANKRLVFTFAPTLGDAIGKLKQSAVYSVTFTFNKGLGDLNFGAVTKIE